MWYQMYFAYRYTFPISQDFFYIFRNGNNMSGISAGHFIPEHSFRMIYMVLVGMVAGIDPGMDTGRFCRRQADDIGLKQVTMHHIRFCFAKMLVCFPPGARPVFLPGTANPFYGDTLFFEKLF